jgi:hypothetical protein
MISFFEDIFQYEKFPTEHECFKQLKDYGNYIAVPWTQILNSHWLRFPGNKGRDFYLRELSRYKVTTNNNFTVCQHDSYRLLIDYYKHLNITKVFSTSHDSTFNIKDIDIIPISFAFDVNFSSTVKKDILVSFVGSATTHPLRQVMKDRITGDNFIYRDSYHIDSDINKEKSAEENEYKDILERSRYSLCPRGSVPSSVRFWESLSAGAIPIIISDNFTLPQWDWDNTILRIPEHEIQHYHTHDTLCEFLEQFSTEDEERMRKNCLDAHNKFRKENYINYIKEMI